MADTWLAWSTPTTWPAEAAGQASCDAQIYRRCGKCGAEMRIMAEFAGVTDVGERCDSCGTNGTTVIRHLEKAECACGSCGSTTLLILAGNEEPRCSKCGQTDLTIQFGEIVPPFPERFSEAVASHHWGVSGQDDARAVLSELQSASAAEDVDQRMMVSARFCRRLRRWGGYPTPHDRAILRNIEANICRNYFRSTGALPAAVLALNLFEAAVNDLEQSKDKALEQHNCAMAIYSMLARNSEKDVILATGCNDIRQQGIAYAQQAKEYFAALKDTESRMQTARILHIIGDLYRAGDSNERQLQLSLENLHAAAAIRGVPSQLLENIKLSRRSTEVQIETARQPKQKSSMGAVDEAFENPGKVNYAVIKLEGDPEKVAEDLIRDSLPKTQLDQIDIGNQQGLSRLLACLMLRRNQASLEKDEIIRFVQRNRKTLQSGALDLLKKFAEAGSKVEGGEQLGRFFDYFAEAVTAALEDRPQDINLKSDKLLWLVYALAQQLSMGTIDYPQAVAILSRPQHRDRISQMSLVFMLNDYAESIDTTNQAPAEYVLLILQCATLSGDATSAAAASSLLGLLPVPHDPAAFIEVMRRARELLVSAGRSPEGIDETLKRYTGRFQGSIGDDDL